MEVPLGVLRRAVLVAVPLALVVLIVVTPALLGRDQPATAIPILFLEVFGEGPNETVLVYVRSALGVTRYERLEVQVSGLDAYAGSEWFVEAHDAPSVWLHVPVSEGRRSSVVASATEETGTFRYTLSLEVVNDDEGPILRLLLPGALVTRDFRESFSTAMTREGAS